MPQVHGLWELPGQGPGPGAGPGQGQGPWQLPQAMDLDRGFRLVSDLCWIRVGLVSDLFGLVMDWS